MPIYEFKCEKCDLVFEYLVVGKEDKYAQCPSCGGKDTHRVMSTFSSGSSKTSPASGRPSQASCNSSSGFS